MTQPRRSTTTGRSPMDPMRKTGAHSGLYYLLTFISIPTLAIYSALKSDSTWYVGFPAATPCFLGTVLASSSPSAASAPRSRSSRWSDGRARASHSAS